MLVETFLVLIYLELTLLLPKFFSLFSLALSALKRIFTLYPKCLHASRPEILNCKERLFIRRGLKSFKCG